MYFSSLSERSRPRSEAHCKEYTVYVRLRFVLCRHVASGAELVEVRQGCLIQLIDIPEKDCFRKEM